MADTLIREGIAYGSQPLSPVPQYWNGASYEKVEGTNGSINQTPYNSSGTEIFTSTTPASVKLTATSTVAISGTSTIDVSGAITVEFSATQTMEIVTSAGGTTLFSGANPAAVQLTATSTVTFSGSETIDIQTVPVVGTQANAWSAAATISAGATSNAVDLQYNYNISYFGTITNTATVTLNLLVSQDDTTYYTAATASITAGTSSNFHYSTTTAARYAKLMSSGVSATITATIVGK